MGNLHRTALGRISPNVPKLPPHFLPREDDLAGIKAKVLSGSNQSVAVTGTRKAASIQGMGGIGKSLLATAVARDAEIQQGFPDGIFWVSLGQTPNLLQLQTELAQDLAKAFACGIPDFSDVNGGKKYLTEQLAPRCCFLVLDDVWRFDDLKAFDVAGDKTQLLMTTRDSAIVTSFGAEEHSLDVLSPTQALVLLAGWTDRKVETLPDDAPDVARECGYLPLALSMAGAMLKGKPDNRWGSVLKRLENADLDKIKQQFPDYPYPDLLKTLQVSVEALEPEQRERYLDFAVFPEDTPIPEAVVQTLWATEGLDDLDTEEMLDELVAKSLMRRDDEGRLTLHDLQYDYITKQVEDLPGLHQRLLDAYEAVAEEGWATVPVDGYFYTQAARHFVEAGRLNELKLLLLDYGWLARKLDVTGVNSLIADYEHLPDELDLALVQKTLRLSAHVLSRQPDQLTERLWGHLCGRERPAIQQLLTQSATQRNSDWLKPIRANLTAPDGALLRTLSGHSDSVLSVALSADGRRAISGSSDRTVKVWDVSSGAELHTLEGHSDGVSSVTISADGSRAVSGSYDRTVKVWDVSSGAELLTLEGHSSRVSSVSISADGARAISGSSDQTVKVWDVSTGAELLTLEGHSSRVSSVAISADGSRAISGSADCTVKVWNGSTGAELLTLDGHSDGVSSVAISADGSCAISGSSDRMVKVWDLASGTERQAMGGHSDMVMSVAISPDGGTAISTSYDCTLKVWDLATGSEQQTLSSHSFGVMSVAITPDTRTAVSASYDCTLKVWDLATGGEQQTLSGHSAGVRAVAISPNGRTVVSGSDDSTLKVWDLATGGGQQTLSGHSAGVRAVAISPNGRTVVSGSDDSTLKVWDLATGGEQQTLSGHSAGVRAVAISPDALTTVSASYDCTLKVWDLATGGEQQTLSGHSAGVRAVAISPNGRTVVSGSDDGTLKVWDLEYGAEQCTLSGHRDGIMVTAIISDNCTAVSASYDGTLKVWNLKTSECLATFYGDSPFLCCAIAPDEVTVVAGDQAGVVHFFRIVEGSE